MDELRLKRYRDKIQHVYNYIHDLPLKPKNELEKRGIFYSLQTSIEAIIDMIAMLVKDLGIQVEDDNKNIDVIIEKRSLTADVGDKLKKANGLRNIIIHRYNEIDEEIILESVKEVKELLLFWIKIIEEIINEIKGN